MNRSKHKSTCFALDYRSYRSRFQTDCGREIVSLRKFGQLGDPDMIVSARAWRSIAKNEQLNTANGREWPQIPTKSLPDQLLIQSQRFQIWISRNALWISCLARLVDLPKQRGSRLLDGASSGFGRLSGRTLVKYCICCTSQSPKFRSLRGLRKDRKVFQLSRMVYVIFTSSFPGK